MVVAIEYKTGVENAWSTFMVAVPKVLAFLVILVIGFLVAKVIGKAVTKILRKVNFDRFVQRGVVKHAMAKSRYDASQIAGKLVYYAGCLLALVLAFDVFGPGNAVSQMLTSVVGFIPNLVVAIVIVLIAAAIASWVKDIVSSALGGLSYGALLASVAAGAILVTGIFMALTQVGIAPAIVTGLYYAVLASLVGVTIVAVGGGGIAPMRERWERALNTVDAEAPRVKEHARQAKEQRAAEAQAKAQYEMAQRAAAQQAAQQQAAYQQQMQAQAAAQHQQQPPTQQYAGQPTPPSAYTGSPSPSPAAAATAYPPDATIDLTQEQLQRQGSRPAGFQPPDADRGAPPVDGRP